MIAEQNLLKYYTCFCEWGNFDANIHQLLRREIDAALLDRDRTIKEAHELREKLGMHMRGNLLTVQSLILMSFLDALASLRPMMEID